MRIRFGQGDCDSKGMAMELDYGRDGYRGALCELENIQLIRLSNGEWRV